MSYVVGPMTGGRVVVHAIHSLGTGGLENGVVNLINSADRSFRHVVMCMTTEGPLRERLRRDVEVVSVGKRPGQDPAAFWRLIALLRDLRPGIVHSRNWGAIDAVAAARLAGVRVVVHGEHGREAGDPQGQNPRRRRVRRLLQPLVSRFVTVSRDLERWLVEDIGLRQEKVLTIPNGVDLDRFGNCDRLEARRALGVPASGVILGTVGRLDPVKDQAGLVRAFAEVAQAHREAWLIVAGDGPCRADLLGLACDLRVSERVRFLGECRNVPGILAAMDVFVLPSIGEGMSNTLLEAMASGLPVVATRVGGNPELVEDRVSGRLVPSRDPRALAGAIAEYLDDPHLRSLHGKASRERAAGSFSLERMTEAYTNLYGQLLGRRDGS